MKKFMVILILIALFIAGYAYDQFGWCKKLLFGEPTTHVIQRGEYLSKIAKKYYGRADYWRELSLVNRAPNSNLVFPGEEIIIPSLDVIKEIRRTRMLSKVNAYIKNEEDIIARLKMGEEPVMAQNEPTPADEQTATGEPMTTPERLLEAEGSMASQQAIVDSNAGLATTTPNSEVQSSSSFGLVIGLIGVLFVASLIAFLLLRKKKRTRQITIVDDDDLSLLDEDDESEPDYQEYLKNKSRREAATVVS